MIIAIRRTLNMQRYFKCETLKQKSNSSSSSRTKHTHTWKLIKCIIAVAARAAAAAAPPPQKTISFSPTTRTLLPKRTLKLRHSRRRACVCFNHRQVCVRCCQYSLFQPQSFLFRFFFWAVALDTIRKITLIPETSCIFRRVSEEIINDKAFKEMAEEVVNLGQG